MYCIRLQSLSMPSAEDALAKLWCRLEQHGLNTPEFNVEFGPDDTVRIALTFADPADAVLALHDVELALPFQTIVPLRWQESASVIGFAGSKPRRKTYRRR